MYDKAASDKRFISFDRNVVDSQISEPDNILVYSYCQRRSFSYVGVDLLWSGAILIATARC